MAMNANRQLAINNTNTQKSLEKLSSGFRINRAGDDAAGLSISEKMRAQIRGLNMASKNAQDGISLIQTAEGALDEVHSILQRMRELAVQSANDTNMTTVDRQAMQTEINQLLEEISGIATRTQFNTQTLLDGTFKDKVFHIGANSGQNMKITIGAMTTNGLKIDNLKVENIDDVDETTTGGILTQEDADKAITTINNAINQVSTQRSELGAIQNRLEQLPGQRRRIHRTARCPQMPDPS